MDRIISNAGIAKDMLKSYALISRHESRQLELELSTDYSRSNSPWCLVSKLGRLYLNQLVSVLLLTPAQLLDSRELRPTHLKLAPQVLGRSADNT